MAVPWHSPIWLYQSSFSSKLIPIIEYGETGLIRIVSILESLKLLKFLQARQNFWKPFKICKSKCWFPNFLIWKIDNSICSKQIWLRPSAYSRFQVLPRFSFQLFLSPGSALPNQPFERQRSLQHLLLFWHSSGTLAAVNRQFLERQSLKSKNFERSKVCNGFTKFE